VCALGGEGKKGGEQGVETRSLNGDGFGLPTGGDVLA
jgi:hypothetical protein